MDDERVPQELLAAFERGPDGAFRVRRVFLADLGSLVVSLLGPAAYLIATTTLIYLVFRLLVWILT